MDAGKYELLILMLIAPFIVAAMICDARHRKLPNRLTVAIALMGLGLNGLLGGFSGLGSAFLGLLIGFFVLMPFYLFRMLGAGDIKLLGALGAFLGHQWILQATAAGVLLAGVCSAVILLRRKREETAGRWALVTAKLSSLKMLNSDFASHDSLATSRAAIPYGVYLGLAAMGVNMYQIYTLTGGVGG